MANNIYPCLWFDGQAQAAAKFYCSVFKNSKIKADNQMVVEFELDGKKFIGLNGGPHFKFNEAVSFVIDCETQEEIDYYWEKLSADPKAEACGWLKDKYGVSWQVVPTAMEKMLQDKDERKLARLTEAFLKMKKFDIAKLEEALKEKGRSAA